MKKLSGGRAQRAPAIDDRPRLQDVLRAVRRLEIVTHRLVDGLIAGQYHSIFKGQGIEFSELREYHPGDDVRAIDWKVTARFNQPFVKEFVEERDLRVFFIVDCSASGRFGSRVAKQRTAAELIAALLFAAVRNNDAAGLVLFTDHLERFVPARKGRRHALRLLSTLLTHEPRARTTHLQRALEQLVPLLKRRGIIFLISDFATSEDDMFGRPLSHLRNRHDIVAIRITDPREWTLPRVGLIELEDEETGEQLLVDTNDERFRSRYASLVKEWDDRLRARLSLAGARLVDVRTDEPYEVPLRAFFARRKVVV